MKCPDCSHSLSIEKSSFNAWNVYRYYRCPNCEKKWKTKESFFHARELKRKKHTGPYSVEKFYTDPVVKAAILRVADQLKLSNSQAMNRLVKLGLGIYKPPKKETEDAESR